MKKLMFAALVAAVAAGCTSTCVKTKEWEASVSNHWFAKDVDKLSVRKSADGSYEIALNGYREDVSEKLPAFTRDMWLGFGILGRLAAATVNPTVASVPLTTDAVDAAQVADLVKANAEAKAQVAKAKAEAASIQATMAAFAKGGGDVSKATVTCADGSCTVTDGVVTCTDGSCSPASK